MMWRYYLLLTDKTAAEIEACRQAVASGEARAFEFKKALARRVIADFHDGDSAEQAQRSWEAQFQERAVPPDVPSVTLPVSGPEVKLAQLLLDLKLAASKSEAQRKIKEGAVAMSTLDSGAPGWTRIDDPAATIKVNEFAGEAVIFRVGRRLVKATFAGKGS